MQRIKVLDTERTRRLGIVEWDGYLAADFEDHLAIILNGASGRELGSIYSLQWEDVELEVEITHTDTYTVVGSDKQGS